MTNCGNKLNIRVSRMGFQFFSFNNFLKTSLDYLNQRVVSKVCNVDARSACFHAQFTKTFNIRFDISMYVYWNLTCYTSVLLEETYEPTNWHLELKTMFLIHFGFFLVAFSGKIH